MYFGKSWISYFFLLPRIVVNEPIYDSKQLKDTYLIADFLHVVRKLNNNIARNYQFSHLLNLNRLRISQQ